MISAARQPLNNFTTKKSIKLDAKKIKVSDINNILAGNIEVSDKIEKKLDEIVNNSIDEYVSMYDVNELFGDNKDDAFNKILSIAEKFANNNETEIFYDIIMKKLNSKIKKQFKNKSLTSNTVVADSGGFSINETPKFNALADKIYDIVMNEHSSVRKAIADGIDWQEILDDILDRDIDDDEITAVVVELLNISVTEKIIKVLVESRVANKSIFATTTNIKFSNKFNELTTQLVLNILKSSNVKEAIVEEKNWVNHVEPCINNIIYLYTDNIDRQDLLSELLEIVVTERVKTCLIQIKDNVRNPSPESSTGIMSLDLSSILPTGNKLQEITNELDVIADGIMAKIQADIASDEDLATEYEEDTKYYMTDAIEDSLARYLYNVMKYRYSDYLALFVGIQMHTDQNIRNIARRTDDDVKYNGKVSDFITSYVIQFVSTYVADKI